MKNFSGNGDTITIVAAADVSAGDVYQGDAGIGVYHEDALTGESVAVWVKGEFWLPAGAGITGAALDGVDWNGTAIIAAVGTPNAGLLGDNYTSATSVKVIIG
jgi:predicted RecA/RadA family phage recombinase